MFKKVIYSQFVYQIKWMLCNFKIPLKCLKIFYTFKFKKMKSCLCRSIVFKFNLKKLKELVVVEQLRNKETVAILKGFEIYSIN